MLVSSTFVVEIEMMTFAATKGGGGGRGEMVVWGGIGYWIRKVKKREEKIIYTVNRTGTRGFRGLDED